ALFFLVFYSYTKRFTFLCHLFLGVTTAMAPVGAWIAVTGSISWIPLFMGAANTLWVAGFDIIYGSQDYEYDVENGLHSIPVTFGVKNALRIAAMFHLGAMIFLVFVGLLTPALGWIYYIGLGIIAILFIIEHRMIKPEKLTHVNIASYSINQLISVTFLIFGVIDALI
ncbi:MAG TPA: 4-hydroxybenzoate octaprenyltransferase, partial [Acetobacterium sp.]